MSLRRRLILLFFGGILLVWVPVNYFLYAGALAEIDALWDSHLARSARLLLGYLSASAEHGDLERLDEELLRLVPGPMPPATDLHDRLPAAAIRDKPGFAFQLLRRDGSLLLASPGAPAELLARGAPGFSYRVIDGTAWRVYGVAEPSLGLILYAGEDHAARKDLAWHLVEHLVFPSLLAIPPLLLLIWLAVNKGLMPLSRLVRQVKRRAPSDLHPLADERVPEEVKPLVDELNSLFARLERALESERQFTGNAAHELRTPLAALRVQAQVAQRATDDAQRQRALSRTIAVVDQASHLVDQLLTLARLDSRDAALTMTPLDLGQIARGVAQDLEPLAQRHQASIQVAANDRAVSVGDETCLGILIRNLLDNAVRYGGGEVILTLRHMGLFNLVIVTDSGRGISDGQHEDMLRRFRRGAGGGIPGSGLGLSIVRRICELHGGGVELRNRESGGLCCEVWLPAVLGRPTPPAQSRTSQVKDHVSVASASMPRPVGPV